MPDMSNPPPEIWTNLVEVIAGIQASVHKANDLLAAQPLALKQGVHYFVGELSIAIAAEVVSAQNATMVRFPSHVVAAGSTVPDAQLSRITLTMRPMPFFNESDDKANVVIQPPPPPPPPPAADPTKPVSPGQDPTVSVVNAAATDAIP